MTGLDPLKRVHVWLWQEEHWHVVQCCEVDVASQGGTVDEAILNIKEALALHFEVPVGLWIEADTPAAATNVLELNLAD